MTHEHVTEAFCPALGRRGLDQAIDNTPADASPLAQAHALNQGRGGEVERAAAEAAGIGWRDDLAGESVSATFVEAVPIGHARRHQVIGLAAAEGPMPVAIASLAGLEQVDVLSRFLNRPMTPVMAPPEAVLQAINTAYQQRTGEADAVIEQLDRQDVLAELDAEQTRKDGDLLDNASRAPVIKLVNLIIFEAVKALASDIHIQPLEDRVVVRTRIDGVLGDSFSLPTPTAMLEEMVSRVKVIGRMNIAEKRLPQDGRATVNVGDRVIDLRISSVPTAFGERIVIRLLDKSVRLYTLPELGMAPGTLESFRGLIGVEHGLVLVTGPTGSGKSTTLYAALQNINAKQRNIITLEDPIEYQLAGVSQIQVNPRKGMTFASGLRSVLRQDPDIIMVGEIRDRETAVMAIQSALTGHLVFSTLHTNDAASAVTRLLDLGIEPYLAASSIVGVVAQRLVRTVCGDCAQPHRPSFDELGRLDTDLNGLDLSGMRRGAGCPSCRGTGYRGREGIFELLTVDDEVRALIQARATAGDIKASAVQHGMRTLHDHGVQKVLSGRTTAEEVVRVTMRSTT